MLKQLRGAKERYRRHRSPRNLSLLNDLRASVSDAFLAAKEDWIVSQCESLPDLPEKKKWNVINKLSNFSPASSCVQPLRESTNGIENFVFDDVEIRHRMENYHISKDIPESEVRNRNAKIKSLIGRVKKDIHEVPPDSVMSYPISIEEVNLTFPSSAGAVGPDHVHAALIDKEDRDAMSSVHL